MLHSMLTRFATLCGALLLLSACGGGSDLLAGVGSGGTGTGASSTGTNTIASTGPGNAIGTVTGFGSLIVDGIRRNDNNAKYFSEAEQGVALDVPMTALMLGQTIELAYDANGDISSALMSPEIVGTVSAVAANSITVLGTPIVTNSDAALGPVTSLVGYVSLNSVQVGERVEAHGLLKTDSQGKPYLQATLIRQMPTASGFRLSGVVSQYNVSTGSFALGNQTVTADSAAISPAGVALADGQLVTVWSNSAPVGNVLDASTIRIKRPAAGKVSLSGAIANYVSNSNFLLRSVTVDASAAAIAPSSATLGNDRYVVVSGNYDAVTNKLTASSVTIFTPAAPSAVEVHGMVANFVSTTSFTLRGVVIDASYANFTGGTASQLANGVFLEVHGTVEGNVVRATTVQFSAFTPSQAPNGSIIEAGGMLTAYYAKTGAFTLILSNGASMSGVMDAGVVLRNGTAANLVAGQSVDIMGMFNNGSLTGTEANFQSELPPSPGVMQISGIVSNVTASGFMLNGIAIQRNGAPIQDAGMMGSSGGVMAGRRVNVSIQFSGGQYLATAISLLDN